MGWTDSKMQQRKLHQFGQVRRKTAGCVEDGEGNRDMYLEGGQLKDQKHGEEQYQRMCKCLE